MDITANKELQNKLEKVTDLWLECSFSDEFDAVTDVMRVEYCGVRPVAYYIQPYLNENDIIVDMNNNDKPVTDWFELGTIEEWIIDTFGLDENPDFPEYSED